MTKEKVFDLLRQYWQYLLGGLSLIIAILGFSLFSGESRSEQSLDLVASSQLSETSDGSKESQEANKDETDTESNEIIVDVKGAVKNPSVYTVDANLRVNDLIKLAGGFTADADQKSINLAAKLSDAQVIYVATVQEGANSVVEEQAEAGDQAGETSTASDKVNINTADKTQLQTLTGIGEKRAQDIIDYRSQNGLFKTVDDLKNVSGFGEKTVEKLKESITVD